MDLKKHIAKTLRRTAQKLDPPATPTFSLYVSPNTYATTAGSANLCAREVK